MLQIEITAPNGGQRLLQVPDDSIIGKSARNEIHLISWRVSKDHARFFLTPAGVLVDDMGGFGGVSVNGQRIELQYGPLRENDVVAIGPFKLRVTERAPAPSEAATSAAIRIDSAP